MRTYRGIPASPGTAVAPAYLHRPGDYDVPECSPDVPKKSTAQLASALDAVASSLEAAAHETSGEAAEILRAQAALARDPALRHAAQPTIDAGGHPARAVLGAGDYFARQLELSGNAYLAARATDVRHICDHAARSLVGASPPRPPDPVEPCVVVADDLMPAETVDLDPTLVRGIVTAQGSRTSHTAVIARALGIPAAVGVRGVVDKIARGERIALDGASGEVFVDPDGETQRRLERARRASRERHQRLLLEAGQGPTRMLDGLRVEVAGNVGGVEELQAALLAGAEGVGLLRTELLYADRDTPPSLDEQVAVLRSMRRLLGDEKRLVVRTFDLGSDKQVLFLPVRPERNPELGVRGVRLARLHPELLDTQLQALAVVAGDGPLAVMAPMVATVEEALWFKDRVAAAGVPPAVEVGVMVEVPALALVADQLAPHVDFMSVGTNDLTQYLFAADRRDGELAPLQDAFSAPVLRAVAAVCGGARDRAWVGVCGEAASDPAWAVLAVGLGVTELSMQAVAVPEVRAALRRLTADTCRDAATRALDAHDPAEARAIGSALLKE